MKSGRGAGQAPPASCATAAAATMRAASGCSGRKLGCWEHRQLDKAEAAPLQTQLHSNAPGLQ